MQADKHSGRPISHIVIPARLASSRLPGKLLLRETGKSLLEHTYDAACRASRPSGVCVAADHPEIAAEVKRFGGEVMMTDPFCASGTDRVAEVAGRLTGVDIFVNVQGDEPELSGHDIDQVVELLEQNPHAMMSTLATPIRTLDKLQDPACVKVVFNDAGQAMYFSRSIIPRPRDWDDALLEAETPHFFQHLGLYAYRRKLLLELAQLPRPAIEQLENLEQLRVLHAGHPILVGVTQRASIGIDTPEDYRSFVARMKAG